jgi:hypothetical protein
MKSLLYIVSRHAYAHVALAMLGNVHAASLGDGMDWSTHVPK